tara:strand:+ start:10 stop:468 length:459 start_codon:yes stop_codon:yes gene_type:complete
VNNLCKFLTDEPEPDILYKKCISCKELKPLTEYGYRNFTIGGKEETINTCKECKSKENKLIAKWKKEYPKPDKNDVCPGCLETEDDIKSGGGWEHHIKKDRTVWRVDHDHETDTFRDYLCDYCNNVLGRAKDNPDTLRRLADYIEYHRGAEK